MPGRRRGAGPGLRGVRRGRHPLGPRRRGGRRRARRAPPPGRRRAARRAPAPVRQGCRGAPGQRLAASRPGRGRPSSAPPRR
ncbi:MAG: hypothetical protein DCC50_03855 [Acidobacteria bacterium]|nr:MAG: hypothetical protein DCC50_03855 [Acidobacteriota bacterium]